MEQKYCPACDHRFIASTEVRAVEMVKKHIKKWADGGDVLHAQIMELEGWEELPFEMT